MSSDSDEGDAVSVDVLYDPTADDADADWVEDRRNGLDSDAVLSCPCCFTTLCLECRRHPTRLTCYKAENVINCRMTITPDAGKGVHITSVKVECDVCNCLVAVYKDGFYLFFNALPSTA